MSSLQEFAPDVFVVDGPPVSALGITFPTRMIIVRLASGALWINSPVTLPAQTLDSIRALGRVGYLVAPTRLHVWRLEEWHALFPEAELWTSEQIPREFKRLPFAGILGNTPPQAWSRDLDQLIFKGNALIEETEFFHPASRTLIMGDFIQNHRPRPGRPLLNLLLRLAGVAYPHGGVPRDIRLTFLHRKLARESLARLLSWDFDKLILAHGVCIENDAKRFVQQAFRWLGE
jgi:hypothetical protein